MKKLLRECCPCEYGSGVGSRVDREAGVIRNVKVIGLQSANGYRYSPEALAKAAPLYEGVKVYESHEDRDAPRERRLGELIGWLENVRAEPDGLYADLQFLRSSPHAAQLCECAERSPHLFGLSPHHAGEVRDGVVTEIAEVMSVDLVMQPATTAGLYESRSMKRTLSQLLESTAYTTPGHAILREMADDMPALSAVEIDAPAPETPPADALKEAFKSVVMEILNGEDSVENMKTKLLAVLDAKQVVDGTPDTPVLESEDETLDEEPVAEDDEAAAEEKQESRKLRAKVALLEQRLRQHQTEAEVRALFEKAGIRPTPVQLKAAAALSGRERTELIESMRPAAAGAAPRSGPLRTATTAPTQFASAADLANFLNS